MGRFLIGVAVGLAGGYLFSDEIDKLFENSNIDNPKKVKDEAAEKVKSAVDTDVPGGVPQASMTYPATGTTLSYERQQEINNSTPEDPVVLTDEDIDALDIRYVKVGLGSRRFKLTENQS